jgi:hypothetical protein
MGPWRWKITHWSGGMVLLEVERGTPQGAVISPVLANIYLHYVYDL